MYPRSTRFDEAIRWGAAAYGATVVSRIDAYRAGVRIASDLPWVPPSSVTVDETASAWRTCEVTIADMDRTLIPKTPQAALSPYGTDLFIQTGFRFADGSLELLPMGVFRILTGRDTRQGKITLLGYDYSRVVARARFEVPRVFVRGTTRKTAIDALIAERTPNVGPPGHTIVYSTSVAADDTIPLTIFEEGERYGDPWKACTDLAEAGGLQVFFTPNGPWPTAMLRPVPDLIDNADVWTFDTAAPRASGSTLVDMKREQDASVGYNVFVVTGESSELASLELVPVRASAEVTDAGSPIYPAMYGRVPTFLASTFIKTTAQCQAVADASLPRKAGGSESLSITAFAHPAHEGGDIVRARDVAGLGIDSSWIISRFTIPLSLKDPVEYTCRAKRVA